jgi:hypothetical protein
VRRARSGVPPGAALAVEEGDDGGSVQLGTRGRYARAGLANGEAQQPSQPSDGGDGGGGEEAGETSRLLPRPDGRNNGAG